jgi:hypothetical protein
MTDKRETRLVVREVVRTGQDNNCQTVNKHLVTSPRWDSAQRQYIQTDRQSRSDSDSGSASWEIFLQPRCVVQIGSHYSRGSRFLFDTR